MHLVECLWSLLGNCNLMQCPTYSNNYLISICQLTDVDFKRNLYTYNEVIVGLGQLR